MSFDPGLPLLAAALAAALLFTAAGRRRGMRGPRLAAASSSFLLGLVLLVVHPLHVLHLVLAGPGAGHPPGAVTLPPDLHFITLAVISALFAACGVQSLRAAASLGVGHRRGVKPLRAISALVLLGAVPLAPLHPLCASVGLLAAANLILVRSLRRDWRFQPLTATSGARRATLAPSITVAIEAEAMRRAS